MIRSNSLENSQVIEDRYIAYLATNHGQQKIIHHEDKQLARDGSKHPYVNALSATLQGLIEGMATSAFMVLATPLLDSKMRTSIFGPAVDVCDSYVGYTKSLVNLLISYGILVPSEKSLTHLEGQTASLAQHAQVESMPSLCKEGELMKCRVINFIGSASSFLSNNSMLILTTGAIMGMLMGYFKLKDLVAAEIREEELLKHRLEERCIAIASRLKSLPINTAVDVSRQIFDRKQAITDEIVAELRHPSLNSHSVKRIIQPIFKAARNIISTVQPLNNRGRILF